MSHPTNAANPHHHGTVEKDDLDLRAIFGFGLGLAVVTIIAHLLMIWMFNAEVRAVDAANPPRVYPLAGQGQDERRPPEPRLQGGVRTDSSGRLLPEVEILDKNLGVRDALKSLRDEEDAVLAGYGWVDRNNQIVRIPVADAMKLTLQRGLPSRPQGGAAAAAPAPAPAVTPDRK
ncbi:MAG TPA: hypothetical protein VM032_14170 [Vicinamibacterales bacterium]|nr:hypothetical protein [Vicinamibacterales bacterium]